MYFNKETLIKSFKHANKVLKIDFSDFKKLWFGLGVVPLVALYIVFPNDSLAMKVFAYYTGIFIVPLEFILIDILGFEKGTEAWAIPQIILVPYLSGIAVCYMSLFIAYFVNTLIWLLDNTFDMLFRIKRK